VGACPKVRPELKPPPPPENNDVPDAWKVEAPGAWVPWKDPKVAVVFGFAALGRLG
jgi:hypothetical protein